MNRSPLPYYPLVMKPLYKSAPWGGNLIKSLRGNPNSTSEKPIGESWELVDREDSQSIVDNGKLAGRSLRELINRDPEGIVGKGHKADQLFPLLCKIIDAKDDLSLQVHPDEECCRLLENAEPKTEMWYILDHAENAEIFNGIKNDVALDEFYSHIHELTVKKLMNVFKTHAGDSYLINANRVHAIGAGNLIYEIQQNSNTTFRVSDWGRLGLDGEPRELHLDQAKTCIEHRKASLNTDPPLIRTFKGSTYSLHQKNISHCDYFKVDELKLEGHINLTKNEESFQVIYAVDGDLLINFANDQLLLTKGQTCLLPAKMTHIQIFSESDSTFLRAQAV